MPKTNGDSANLSKARLCACNVFRSPARNSGVKCSVVTSKTPAGGLIPRMQTSTRVKQKACVPVLGEVIADFLCFRGSRMLFRHRINQTLCGCVRLTSEFATKYGPLYASIANSLSAAGVPRTGMPTRTSIASYSGLIMTCTEQLPCRHTYGRAKYYLRFESHLKNILLRFITAFDGFDGAVICRFSWLCAVNSTTKEDLSSL